MVVGHGKIVKGHRRSRNNFSSSVNSDNDNDLSGTTDPSS